MQTGEFLFQQLRHIELQNIAVQNVQVFEFSDSFLQNRQQPLVQFHGSHLFGTQCQLLCQGADTRTDLQHTITCRSVALLGDSRADRGVDQKVLPQLLGKVKPVPSQNRTDGFHIC